MSDDLVKRLIGLEIITMPNQPFTLQNVAPWLRANTAIRNEAADRIEGLEAKLAKAVEALDEAVYMLGVTDEDIEKGAAVYRIVSTLKQLKLGGA